MTMPVQTASLVEWALWYASQGHPIFPCHTPIGNGCSCRQSNCTDIGKHPRIRDWPTHATTDSVQIEQWWKQWPLANIGLKTGVTFWALDIDPRKGGDAELYQLEHEHGQLPETPRSKTGGGGNHIAFAMPHEGHIRNSVNLAPGIDVRGEGGYIIVPPSQHMSGHSYAWESTADLEDVPLAPAPAWVVELCQQTTYHAPATPEAAIPDGARNETLSRMAFAMRRAGMSLKEIYTAIVAVNDRCTPPLDHEELQLIAEGKRHIGPDPVLKIAGEKPAEAKQWPTLIHAISIMQKTYRPTVWTVEGLIPEGLTIVGGLPKVAKSYFAYDLALARVGNGLALGHFGVARGKAAYFAIEDDEADTKTRITELREKLTTVEGLFFLHGDAVPGISDGLVDYLRLQVTTHELSLVIIDPLSYVYDPKPSKNGDSFREAKDMLLPLRQLARELHFSLVFVDHRRKQGKDDVDVFQTLYGSVAKYAVADALIMMVRKEEEVTLHCRGRKIKDQVITCELAFSDGHAYWKVHAAHEELGEDRLRGKIINAFKDAERLTHKRAFTLSDIMDYAEFEQSPQMRETVRVTMVRMVKSHELLKADRNLFILLGDDDDAGVTV